MDVSNLQRQVLHTTDRVGQKKVESARTSIRALNPDVTVIAHEMGHGFDDQGRRYDAKGQLRDWWTAQDAANYKARADQVEAQFNAYTVLDSLHVNGKLIAEVTDNDDDSYESLGLLAMRHEQDAFLPLGWATHALAPVGLAGAVRGFPPSVPAATRGLRDRVAGTLPAAS